MKRTMLLAVLALALVASPALAKDLGDVTCEGQVGARDALVILQVEAGLAEPTACYGQGDANADTRVDAADALVVLQYTGGLIGELG